MLTQTLRPALSPRKCRHERRRGQGRATVCARWAGRRAAGRASRAGVRGSRRFGARQSCRAPVRLEPPTRARPTAKSQGPLQWQPPAARPATSLSKTKLSRYALSPQKKGGRARRRTSSRGTGSAPALNLSMPRRLMRLLSSWVSRAYSRYASRDPVRAASCERAVGWLVGRAAGAGQGGGQQGRWWVAVGVGLGGWVGVDASVRACAPFQGAARERQEEPAAGQEPGLLGKTQGEGRHCNSDIVNQALAPTGQLAHTCPTDPPARARLACSLAMAMGSLRCTSWSVVDLRGQGRGCEISGGRRGTTLRQPSFFRCRGMPAPKHGART